MKNLILGVCLFFAGSLSAQIMIGKKDINTADIKYIELVATQAGLFTGKVNIVVDFGERNATVKDDKGKPIDFNTVVAALNYFDKNGWEYVNNFVVSEGTIGHVYHYLLRRKKE